MIIETNIKLFGFHQQEDMIVIEKFVEQLKKKNSILQRKSYLRY